jgi:tubulin-specific chaperone A
VQIKIAPEATTESPPPAIEDTDTDIPKILIVEDDLRFARILQDLSRDRGFETLLAADGLSGLNEAVKHRPQAIFLDIHLPEMDGIALLEHLSAHPETRHIPVHAMSVDNYETDTRRLGAVGFLEKPASNSSLDAAFQRIESMARNPVRRLLIVEDDNVQRNAIIKLLSPNNDEIDICLAADQKEAIDHLRSGTFDCMILDLNLKERMSGVNILEHIAADDSCSYPPVIVYTGMDLAPDEEAAINRLAKSIIVKGAASEERLLDEATLFLHRMTSRLPPKQQKTIEALHASQYDDTIGKTILVVDDDSRNIFAITHILEQHGMEVIQARNGLDALEKLGEHPEVDLVLMDIMMPEMDGYEATRAIRQQPQHAKLPIIALTAKAMKHDRLHCLDAGANDYMTKPIDVDRLMSLLLVWLY